MVWANEAVARGALGPVGLGQEVGDLDALRLDRLGRDALAGEERRDLGAIGIDLGLDLVEVVAGRGVAQRPDRQIRLDEGLCEALDRDEVLVRAAALKTVADQPAGAEHPERDQPRTDQVECRSQERHSSAVRSVAKELAILSSNRSGDHVTQALRRVNSHREHQDRGRSLCPRRTKIAACTYLQDDGGGA
jgi:hypothetical protein